MSQVRLITIGYSNAFDQDSLNLHTWQTFESRQKAIDFLNERRYPNGLTRTQNLELHTLGCTTVEKEHIFILYADEQKRWIKTLIQGAFEGRKI